MNYKGYIKTKEEYKTLKNVLQRNIGVKRRTHAILTVKGQSFLLMAESLYLISHFLIC